MNAREWLQQNPYLVIKIAPELALEEMIDLVLKDRLIANLYVLDDDGALMGSISSKNILEHYLLEHQPTPSRRQMIHRVTQSCASDMLEINHSKAGLEEGIDVILPRMLHADVTEMVVVDEQGQFCGVIDLYTLAKSLIRTDYQDID